MRHGSRQRDQRANTNLEAALAHPDLYDKVIVRSDYAEHTGVIVKLATTVATVELMEIQNQSVLISDLVELEPGVWEYRLS